MTVAILNRCDCCGGKAIHQCSEGFPHLNLRYVECSECGIKTKNFQTGKEAADCWNEWMMNKEVEPD